MSHRRIIQHDVSDNLINVVVDYGDEHVSHDLSREKFQQWLSDTGKLNWIMDYADQAGNHEQHTGTLDAEEYWEQRPAVIEADLEEYINQKKFSFN